MKTYKGTYIPKNKNKYYGTIPIIYRSSWELAVFNWIDSNPKIVRWGSESVVVPYQYTIEKDVDPSKWHRYFIDIDFMVSDGKKYLIEIKPKSKTTVPKMTGRNKIRQVEALLEHRKNIDKWEAAKRFADANGYVFQVWTEDTLKNLGIKILI